jgi:DNA polymerase III subunit epsilon
MDIMFLFFDCETTGLPKNREASIMDADNWPRVIQVAWLLCNEAGHPIESDAHLIQPNGFIIPPEAQRIHGITTEQALAKGKKLIYVLNTFSIAVEKSEIIVAHNLKFDEKVLSAEYFRMNLPLPFLREKKRFCTMENSAEFCRIPGTRGYKWPSLSQLYWKLFKINLENSHDASVDVAACAKCFFEFKQRGMVSLQL